MAEHRSVQHGFEGEPSLSARVKQAGVHFSWLSENVTAGPDAEFIQPQFMQSPNHRANILDTDMNSIGVGVVERGGQLFAVEDFAQATDVSPATRQPQKSGNRGKRKSARRSKRAGRFSYSS